MYFDTFTDHLLGYQQQHTLRGGVNPSERPPTGLCAETVSAELRLDGVTYRILLEGAAAEHARQAYASGEHAGIPNGKINPGDGGVNIGHEWHITEVEWADITIEVCDGNAGYIDDLGYEEFVNQHGDRFCPWSAELIELIEP
jgi:hypothetical protein